MTKKQKERVQGMTVQFRYQGWRIKWSDNLFTVWVKGDEEAKLNMLTGQVTYSVKEVKS